MLFAATWADLEIIIVSEAKSDKDKYQNITPRDDLPLRSDCFSKLSA